jgi:hypothetical protein
VVRAARAWLAAERALSKAKRKDAAAETTKAAERKAEEAFDARQSAARTLNACVDEH